MNCYLHPQAESVVTCGKCGVAMCRECESNAFFRLDNGKGQALCNRCSLTAAQENVDFEASWLKKRMIKLVFCGIFVLVGIISFFTGYSNSGIADAIFFAIIPWAIAGVIANIGAKQNNGSLKSQAKDAVYEYEHPILSFLIGVVVYGFLGPFLFIANIVGYMRTKADYKRDLESLEIIRASVNQ